MSVSNRWQLAAVLLMVVGINWLTSDTDWLGMVGGGLVGVAIACIGWSTDARLREQRRADAGRFAKAMRGAR